MPSSSPSSQGSIRPPHPLTERLISRLRNLDHSCAPSHIRILEIGTGSGRNAHALTSAGFTHVGIPDNAGIPDNDITCVIPSEASSDAQSRDRHDLFHAALTTHSLLHGTPSDIAYLLHAIAAQLKPNGLLYATFGSTRDTRFGRGEKLGKQTFAPLEGDERGVAHSYFDEQSLREILAKNFAIERLEEIQVDTIAGSWAHNETPLRGAFHWFVEATVRSGAAIASWRRR